MVIDKVIDNVIDNVIDKVIDKVVEEQKNNKNMIIGIPSQTLSI